jgi:hypothetical protein
MKDIDTVFKEFKEQIGAYVQSVFDQWDEEDGYNDHLVNGKCIGVDVRVRDPSPDTLQMNGNHDLG